MACNPKRIADLDIREDYKVALLEYFQQPDKQQECEMVTSQPPEQLKEIVDQLEAQVMSQNPENQAQGGQPPAGGLGALPQGGQPRRAPAPSDPQQSTSAPIAGNVPPGQMANTPEPMNTPPAGAPRGYARGGIVSLNNPVQYRQYGGPIDEPIQYRSIGGFIKKAGKKISSAFGGDKGTVAMLIGGAIGAYTGNAGWMEAGASFGAAAGTYADTGSLTNAIGAGAMGYGAASLAGNAANNWGAKSSSELTGANAPDPRTRPNTNTSGWDPQAAGWGDTPKSGYTESGVGSLNKSGVGGNTGNTGNKEQGWFDKYGKYVMAAPMLMGIGEEPDNTRPESIRDTTVEDYYAAKAIDPSTPRPESMRTRNVMSFGSADREARRGADGIIRAADGGSAPRHPDARGSDTVPAMLTPGEFVMTKGAVQRAGNGDMKAGTQRMYELMAQLEGGNSNGR